MSEPVVQGPAPEIAMNNIPSPKADKTPEASPDAPSTTFIQLDGRSPVPSQFRTSGTFTITRLQSPAGLPDRITKLSPVPALLVSISLQSLPREGGAQHQRASAVLPLIVEWSRPFY